MALSDIQDRRSILRAIREFDRIGREAFLTHYGFGRSREYFLEYEGKLYDSKAIVGAAHGFEYPEIGALGPHDFSQSDATVRPKLESLDFVVVRSRDITHDVSDELARRLEIWRELKNQGGPDGVTPAAIKSLGIHRGQQGIFRDLEVTGSLTANSTGVAVGILQTGRVYSDDLSEQGLTYHYPSTDRGRRDSNEIAAMKACGELGVPMFVVIKPDPAATTRNVRLGWVQEHDDDVGLLLIAFLDSDAPPVQVAARDSEEAPFSLLSERVTKRRQAKVRPNQWRFRFDVFKRYGNNCAVCSISHPDLLEAAHVCAVESHGSDDARNGLVLCLTHHRAFDKSLFKINPDTLNVVAANYAGQLSEIGISRVSIDHLSRRPHAEALRWAWNRGAQNAE